VIVFARTILLCQPHRGYLGSLHTVHELHERSRISSGVGGLTVREFRISPQGARSHLCLQILLLQTLDRLGKSTSRFGLNALLLRSYASVSH